MSGLSDEFGSWIRSELRTPLMFALKFVGFVASFAACALILSFINFELRYDAWNPNAARIVRAVETNDVKTGSQSVSLPYAFGDAANVGLPDVESVARMQPLRVMLKRGQDRFNEMIYFAEPSLLKIFPVSILKGDRQPLDRPNSVLISERAAKNYFGAQDPIGQVLSISGSRDVTVAAVMRDWPADSHIQPDFLISLESFFAMAKEMGNVPRAAITGWGNCHCYVTYLLFRSPDSIVAARERLRPLLVSQQGEQYAERYPVQFQSLRDIYLGSANLASYLDHAAKGDRLQLLVFTSATVLLLLIAGLSFANYSTAQAMMRAREFAVRRILGAQRGEITLRLTLEATAVALVSAIVGFVLALMLVDLFASFANRPITAGSLLEVSLIAQLAGVTVLVGVLSGLAPGIVIASTRPLALLGGTVSQRDFRFRGQTFRAFLLGLQFVVSCVLIVFAIAVRSELTYVREQPLGFEPNATLIVNGEGAQNSLSELMTRIAALPGVRAVSIANAVPTVPLRSTMRMIRQGLNDDDDARSIQINNIDFGLLKTLGIRTVAGRELSTEYGADSLQLARYQTAVNNQPESTINAIINLKAVRELGFDSPEQALGQVLKFSGRPSLPFSVQIVGVVEDARYGGPREVVNPMLYMARTDWQVNLHQQQYLVATADPQAMTLLPAQITRIWDELVPAFVADITHLDERVARLVDNERRQLRLVTTFMVTTILLSILGILGFAAFVMHREARTLAIRRVLGATREEIALLISTAQLRVVAVGIALGCPIAWWAITHWLDNFTVRVPVSIVWFAAGSVAIAFVSFAALFVFTLRLSATSPVKYLRAE